MRMKIKEKYKIIKLEEKDYPEKLKKIKRVPKVLYGVGNIELLNDSCFAIVGTRKISDYGKENCEKISKEFAYRDIPVVSGMAIGTDAVAHKTVLKYGGKTIAVLGSGFNHIYPKENTELFYEILENDGLIITEYEKNVEPYKRNFPARNRIITAISEGVLVIEAAYRSGTSITANNAKDQGKKVFALPGKLDSYLGIGVNRLIKEGAILTTSINDIIEHYPQFMSKKRKTNIKNLSKVGRKYLKIYKLIEDEGKFLEDLIENSGLRYKEVITLLMEMELKNLIYRQISGKYMIKKQEECE